MEDKEIIDLYLDRDETAISATAKSTEITAILSPTTSYTTKKMPKKA